KVSWSHAHARSTSVSDISELPSWASWALTPVGAISPNCRRRIKLLAQKKDREVNLGPKKRLSLARAFKATAPRRGRPPRGREPLLSARFRELRPLRRPGRWRAPCPCISFRKGTSRPTRHRPR